MAGFWNVERKQSAQTLFNTGSSASESAISLSREFGERVSRNAVIGLWHRNKWSGRESQPRPWPNGTKARTHRSTVSRENASTTQLKVRNIQRVIASAHGALRIIDTTEQDIAELRAADVVPLHLNLLDLEHGQCRYPYGDSPFTFCGHPVLHGSYCVPHAFLCSGDMDAYRNRSAAQQARRGRERAVA